MKAKEEIVFLNGKFISPQEAKISPLCPAFLYGLGLFETMRSYNGNIVYFDSHLRRIKKSAGLIGINFPYPIIKIKEIIKEAVKRSGFRDIHLRLTLWNSGAGTDILVVARKYQPPLQKKYKQGLRACISLLRQEEKSFLAGIKTSNRLLYELSYQQAKNKEFDESIILNNIGYISEASRSNIFFIQDKQLFTPSLECGCLRGITRKVIFDLAKKYSIPLNEGKFRLDDLYNSDEAFLTNSLVGVMPLTSIENRIIGKGESGRLTRFLIRKYNYFLL